METKIINFDIIKDIKEDDLPDINGNNDKSYKIAPLSIDKGGVDVIKEKDYFDKLTFIDTLKIYQQQLKEIGDEIDRHFIMYNNKYSSC